MTSSTLLILSLISFLVAYHFYGKFLRRKFEVSDENPTPATLCKDNCDFVAAKSPLILFGHHFSSIAGAGPIIGPIIAALMFGWKGTILWIIIGSIFLGGVSDFGALILSIRSGGKSISDSSGNLISKGARKFFIIFVILALILVNAIFTLYAARTLTQSPDIALSAMGLIPIAFLFGFLVYQKNFNVTLSTIIALSIFVILIVFSKYIPIYLSFKIWAIILLTYALIASILPVNLLLQPRDYLSSFLLYLGMITGIVGIVFFNKELKISSLNLAQTSTQNIWPMLFITVACGAISGFHTLIASGTTSKQIARESHSLPIGYGAMLVEGLLAVIALITVSAAITDNPTILANRNPITIFGYGFGKITSNIFGTQQGTAFAILLLNSFILTTLDTSVRITRYLTEELIGKSNKIITSFFVVIVSGLLTFSGEGEKIWPVFGASNQLVAALALMVVTMWLVSKKKKHLFTLLPAIFMFATTLAGLILKTRDFLMEKKIFIAFIPFILSLLAIYSAIEFTKVYISSIKKKGAS